MVQNIYTNIMGTASFEAKFPKMNKFQDFSVYPIEKNSANKIITIQSSTRIGKIDLETGKMIITKSYPNGAYFHHLSMGDRYAVQLSESDTSALKIAIILTADENAGKSQNGIVSSDNSGAINLMD